MDLALNNLQWLICHKNKPNQIQVLKNISTANAWCALDLAMIIIDLMQKKIVKHLLYGATIINCLSSLTPKQVTVSNVKRISASPYQPIGTILECLQVVRETRVQSQFES